MLAIVALFAALLGVFPTPIQHVIVIIQQHRSVDNLFNGFPGADTVRTDPVSGTPLVATTFTTNAGPNHRYTDGFQPDYAGGLMNAWPTNSLVYLNDPAIKSYWGLAQQYAFADEVFAAQEGESFPASLFLISGQSGGSAGDGLGAFAESGITNGCGQSSGADVVQYNHAYPAPESTQAPTCRDWPTLMDSATSWAYYANNASTARAAGAQAISHLYAAQHNIVPETTFLTDIGGGTLRELTYVTPSDTNSDHPAFLSNSGPQWVVSLIRAVCKSSFWPSTTILVTWDAFGGFFDHVKPPVGVFTPLGCASSCNPLEAGFRTPLIVISPYARSGIVDHTLRTQCAIPGYIEATLGLPSLGLCDTYSAWTGSAWSGTDTLAPMFDYSQAPQSCIADPGNRRYM